MPTTDKGLGDNFPFGLGQSTRYEHFVLEIFRMGVISIVHNERGLRIVGDKPKLADAATSIESSSPDLRILDLQDGDLIRDLPQLVRDDRNPATKSIVVTAASNTEATKKIGPRNSAVVQGLLVRSVNRSNPSNTKSSSGKLL